MVFYYNTNLSLLTEEDISNLIIRKNNNNYIIGIVTESSGMLHKKKRFRPGGLFCEEIFGILYTCCDKCDEIYEFNTNPILNKLCINCKKFMKFNFKRKHIFGSIFLNFPIVNYYYFKGFINLFKIFKSFNSELFHKKKYFKINNVVVSKNIFFTSSIIENRFLNFINLFYKNTNPFEFFKLKLDVIDKNKITTKIKLNKFNKFINNFICLKDIFLTIFPILPAGLRKYCFSFNKKKVNSKLNYLYEYIIDVNNSIDFNCDLIYNIKNILILSIMIEVILDFSKPSDIFNNINEMCSKFSGKYGIFRQNLLGFRVDYSGRTSIIPKPSMVLNNIGLPYNMIGHHFKSYFIEEKFYDNYESSDYNNNVLSKLEFFSDSLSNYCVLANRAPTLHKMNVQSFNPIFVEGESIKFMPILCSGYNADFDGDQMGIFSLTNFYSIKESLNMLRPLVNLFSPTTKKSIFNLTQSMLVGYNVLSNYNYLKFNFKNIFSNYVDMMEFNSNNILVDCPFILRTSKLFYFTTNGRLLIKFNI